MRVSALKALLFRFAAVFISLLIAALVFEGILRIFVPARLRYSTEERSFFCRFDRQLGWAPLENISGRQSVEGKRFVVHQNQFGLRGPDDMRLQKTLGKKRILVLGDSYVWGFGVNQENLFSAPEVHRTNDEIINFGVSGYGTDQEYLFYLLKGQSFEVDEVILAFTLYNDVDNNLASTQYSRRKPYFRLEGDQLVLHNEHIRDTKLRSIRDELYRHSRVCNLMAEGFAGLMQTLLPTRHKPDLDVTVSDTDRDGIKLTLAIIKKLKEAVVANRAEFSVVFIPYEPHIKKHLPDDHPFAPLIATGLSEMGAHYREPYPKFLKASLAGVKLFNPDHHFTSEGHALFAKFVTDSDEARASVDYYAH
jgi:hypothetical protein